MSERHIEELTNTELEATSSSTSATSNQEAEEVEAFKQRCREGKRIGDFIPTSFDEDVALAISKGVTVEELKQIIVCFRDNLHRWGHGHRAGALSYKLRRMTPHARIVVTDWPHWFDLVQHR